MSSWNGENFIKVAFFFGGISEKKILKHFFSLE